VVTILSELALLIPFYWAVRKYLGPLPWAPSCGCRRLPRWSWPGHVASAGHSLALLIPVAAVVYLTVLALCGGFRQPDMSLLLRALPLDRLRARLSAFKAK